MVMLMKSVFRDIASHCLSDKRTEKDPVFAEMIMIISIFIIMGDEGVVSSPG